ncbi:class I SAM-dependent methyltransferase [Thermodesulfobacteriota bacterium]
MQRDRERWNEKYLKKSFSTKPSQLVKKYYKLAPKGRALDVAAGTGKNALFLAQQEFKVEAVEVSDVALRTISRRHPNLHPVCMDIDTFDIPRERYSLILNIRFLSRRLFPYIQEGLMPGGVLIFETYLDGPLEETGGPTCRDYLLRENELLHAFLSLKILYYQESKQSRNGESRYIASLVAIK